jgi:hypothetical protein
MLVLLLMQEWFTLTQDSAESVMAHCFCLCCSRNGLPCLKLLQKVSWLIVVAYAAAGMAYLVSRFCRKCHGSFLLLMLLQEWLTLSQNSAERAMDKCWCYCCCRNGSPGLKILKKEPWLNVSASAVAGMAHLVSRVWRKSHGSMFLLLLLQEWLTWSQDSEERAMAQCFCFFCCRNGSPGLKILKKDPWLSVAATTVAAMAHLVSRFCNKSHGSMLLLLLLLQQWLTLSQDSAERAMAQCYCCYCCCRNGSLCLQPQDVDKNFWKRKKSIMNLVILYC